jgi:FKBP-type peptidyl-prolyl cis-trans isomerase FklB
VRISLGKVIPAWKEALPLMKDGAKWQLFVPPELGYGALGSTGIGPNSTLLFDVELLGVVIRGAPEQASAAPTR